MPTHSDSQESCERCGKGFELRFPGTSVKGHGPMHSYCIAAELETALGVCEAIRDACRETCPPSGISQEGPVRFWHQPGCDGECQNRFQLAVAAALEGKS